MPILFTSAYVPAIRYSFENVTEFFIPSLMLCFNSKHEVFRSQYPRNYDANANTYRSEFIKLNVPQSIINKLLEILNLQDSLEKCKGALQFQLDCIAAFESKEECLGDHSSAFESGCTIS